PRVRVTKALGLNVRLLWTAVGNLPLPYRPARRQAEFPVFKAPLQKRPGESLPKPVDLPVLNGSGFCFGFGMMGFTWSLVRAGVVSPLVV
ncbi:MAG: hypothetical protein WCB49_13175, partial [Gammaproteobacteria bacterium]